MIEFIFILVVAYYLGSAWYMYYDCTKNLGYMKSDELMVSAFMIGWMYVGAKICRKFLDE